MRAYFLSGTLILLILGGVLVHTQIGIAQSSSSSYSSSSWSSTSSSESSYSSYEEEEIEEYEICNDFVDNDYDGDVDCDDMDCEGSPYCIPPMEECNNEIDDDKDGYVDCEDNDCTEECEEEIEDCTDEVDNDDDGDIDCADMDCEEFCAPVHELICQNGLDDDYDGYTDCDDSDCASSCTTPAEICNDNIDNDRDGLIDCGDTDCKSSSSCVTAASETSCFNSLDDDDDGLIDCADTDCTDFFGCNICGDGACHLLESCSIAGESNAETCTEDCGVCPAICGNGVCESITGETQQNCAVDCGEPKDGDILPQACGNDICDSGETVQECPSDCLPRIFCGDNLCSGGETFQNCAQDCEAPEEGIDFVPQPSTEDIKSLPSLPILSADLLGDDVQVMESAMEQLQSQINAIDPDFAASIRADGVDLSASLLGRRLINAVTVIAQKLKEERGVMNTAVVDTLKSPHTLRRLNTVPNFDSLQSELNRSSPDLAQIQKFLPAPILSTNVNLARLQFLATQSEDLLSSFPEEQRFISSTFAQKEPEPAGNAKKGFKQSAFLAKRMKTLSIDPETGERQLVDDIAELQNRKVVLAGVVGTIDSDTDSLIKLGGILEYLTSTMNYRSLKGMYTSAFARMRSGVGRIGLLFAWGDISPQAEAAALLDPSTINKLESNHMSEKKKALRALIAKEKKAILPHIVDRPLSDRQELHTRFTSMEQSVQAAKNTEELRAQMEVFSRIVQDLEATERNEHGFFRNIMYAIQDFFGIS